MPRHYEKKPVTSKKASCNANEKTLYDILVAALGEDASTCKQYFSKAFMEELNNASGLEAVSGCIEKNRPDIIRKIEKDADEAYEQHYNGYRIITREDKVNAALDAVIQSIALGAESTMAGKDGRKR